MRIISGKARGQKLKHIKGNRIRPTTDRVKETIFNILAGDVHDAAVLDLFAGSGNLGLEAMSRGAAAVDFVERSYRSIKIIKENLAITGFDGNVIKKDAMRFVQDCETQYDLIFADPPYDRGFIENLMESIEEQPQILSEAGIMVIEHSKREPVILESEIFGIWREKNFGETVVTFVIKKGLDSED
jgi:16S rRNA (guanine(966)-N(2))-methyltransferase RsmD